MKRFIDHLALQGLFFGMFFGGMAIKQIGFTKLIYEMLMPVFLR